jgi:hypothetical protein
MIFQDTITNDLDLLTGLDLNWERFATTLEAELPKIPQLQSQGLRSVRRSRATS